MPVIQTPPDRHVTCPEKDATETWTSRLRTVEEDPFFFDHPLDHLPALLLADGVTELVEHIATTTSATAAGPRPAWRAQTLELEFGSFAEKGLPVELSARALPGTPGGWQVGGRQQGRSVCEGRVSAAPVPPPDTPVLPTPQAAEEDLDCQCAMVAPELVHRHRPENVLLADYRNHGGGYSAELLSPPRGHHLRGAEGRDTELRSLIELVEGARQFVTLLGHEARQVAFDRRYVVASMRAVTTRAIRRAEPVRLWADTLPSVHGGDVHIRFSSGGGAVGEACFSGYAFSPAAYRRLRGASGGEAR
ncbi:AfsA-related hotdog domain-containing protein [Streptomyces sp.]|uniref:AfsA-related hotdog domain-containing protein n=1 Tax=Streptomyces sp. TaxID=1931 RepID=UPI002D7866EF|nr:AfsA-related hotdog domain-containing protein [Streptomyces sp.]HET6357764.1 AfsA-related hotdog domain-containing protein [Streptomyces sp.]